VEYAGKGKRRIESHKHALQNFMEPPGNVSCKFNRQKIKLHSVFSEYQSAGGLAIISFAKEYIDTREQAF
jgi:hypothetical protein